MSTAREVMHSGAECIGENDTLVKAAQMMRDMHVGALPICGSDDRLHGIITDRDIIVKCVADGRNPKSVKAGELADGPPIWVDADAETTAVLSIMIESGIRRVPVLEDHRLVGIISEAEIATQLDEVQVKQFASAIYGAPPNS